MKAIYLIGFMGSGKTSTARMLASRLNCPYSDTDSEIEASTGLSIPEIFYREGEAYFRNKESEILFGMPDSDYVISTGGGIIGKEENRKWMKKNGLVVFLHASWEQITQRLGNDSSRPLWNGNGKKELFDGRQELYQKTAHFVISTDGKTPARVADEIMKKVKQ